MTFLLWFGLSLLCGWRAARGVDPEDPLLVVALEGETVTLPCGSSPVPSCSSVEWNMEEKLEAPLRYEVMRDCSLRITDLQLSDAQIYSCDSGTLNASVSLKILQVVQKPDAPEGAIELHCVLNRYKGYEPCSSSAGVHIRWSSEDGSPLNGDRFHFNNPSDCFSILTFAAKATDHHRKWKCRLTHGGVLKVTSYTTRVKDGLEEVVASVGQSLSLPCRTSSLDVDGAVEWTACERPPAHHDSSACVQRSPGSKTDFSLAIDDVTGLHVGYYRCSGSSGKKVFNQILLHTLDVITTSDPRGDELILTCELNCPRPCGEEFNLTWSESSGESRQSEAMTVNNTVARTLFLPAGSAGRQAVCSARREGALLASKEWRRVTSLQTPAWFLLPLGLSICAAAGGVYIYMRKKRKTSTAKEPSGVGTTHIYDVIEDGRQEEPRRGREAATDTFYHLLQPVN